VTIILRCTVKSSVSLNVNICNFTYLYDTQQVQSYIGYFIINKNLMDSVLDFDIIDCGSNLSDHNPIVLKVSCIGLKLQSTVRTKCATVNEPVQYTLRWDHTNAYMSFNIGRTLTVDMLLIR